MPTNFSVCGPFEVHSERRRNGQIITSVNAREFWREHEDLGSERGVYVFGVRAGRGFTPGYVGKATKSFGQEALGVFQRNRYHEFLSDYRKGTPVMFLIVSPRRRGKPNNAHVGLLEDFLIQTGVAANPNLMNVRGTKQASWTIGGVLRSRNGKPSHAAKAFRRMMKI